MRALSEAVLRAMPDTAHLLALAGSLCAAGATVLIRQGLRGGDTYTGFWINLVVGTAGLWCAVALLAPVGPVSFTGVAVFVVAGLVGTVAPPRSSSCSCPSSFCEASRH
jgi:drug/metabolite transporter (DMT)-like permease